MTTTLVRGQPIPPLFSFFLSAFAIANLICSSKKVCKFYLAPRVVLVMMTFFNFFCRKRLSFPFPCLVLLFFVPNSHPPSFPVDLFSSLWFVLDFALCDKTTLFVLSFPPPPYPGQGFCGPCPLQLPNAG